MMRHTVDARSSSTEALCAGIDAALVRRRRRSLFETTTESRDGDATRTLDERRGAKPPRRVAEPPESARSASRGAQRSVALGCSVDLGVRREGRGSWV